MRLMFLIDRGRLEASNSFQEQEVLRIVIRIKVSQQPVYILLVLVEQGHLEVSCRQDCLRFVSFLIHESVLVI